MSQKKTFIQGAIFTTGGIAINNVMAIATALLTLRILGVRDLGLVSLSLSVFTICNYFLDLGMSGIFSSEMAKKRGAGETGKVKCFFFLLLKIQILTISALLIVLFFTHKMIAGIIGIPHHYLYAIILYLFLFNIKTFYLTFFNSSLLYLWQNFLDVFFFIMRFSIVLFIYIKKPGDELYWILYSYPLAVGGSVMLATGPMVYFAIKKLGGVRAESTAEMRSALWRQVKFGVFLNPMKAVMDVAPLWILRFFAGVSAVGIFHCTISLIRAIYGFIRAMETTLLPMISQLHTEDRSKRKFLMLRMSKYSLWMVSVFIIVMGACIPYVLRLVRPEYMVAIPYFRVGLLLLVPLVYVQVERPLLIALERQDAMIYTDLILIGIIFTAGTLLIYLFGLWGIIALDILIKFLIAMIYYYFIKKNEPDFRLIENPFRFDEMDKKNFRSIITLGRSK